MNAAVLHGLGEVPFFEQFEEPTPGPGEAIVQVRAASIKPADKQMASGTHYASFRELPVVCGIDGVGLIDDGSRVFFAGPRRPFGAMAQRTVVARARCFPIPAGIDDLTAAALPNPGVSAWMSLAWRAQLVPGQTVLVLGATGVTGTLAVQIANLLGAGRVVAAGRNQEALSTMPGFGADSIIPLNQSPQELTDAFIREAKVTGFDIVIDYVWGQPTEALLAAITGADLIPRGSRIRLIQVGESAGPAILLPAAALRSSGLEIMGAGSGAVPPMDVLEGAFQQVMRAPFKMNYTSMWRGFRLPVLRKLSSAALRPYLGGPIHNQLHGQQGPGCSQADFQRRLMFGHQRKSRQTQRSAENYVADD